MVKSQGYNNTNEGTTKVNVQLEIEDEDGEYSSDKHSTGNDEETSDVAGVFHDGRHDETVHSLKGQGTEKEVKFISKKKYHRLVVSIYRCRFNCNAWHLMLMYFTLTRLNCEWNLAEENSQNMLPVCEYKIKKYIAGFGSNQAIVFLQSRISPWDK